MSYILDALKKSEAERSNKDHPEFAHRVPFESAPRKQREIWPYLLVLALLANALVIGYVIWPESGPGGPAVVSGEPAGVQERRPVEREAPNTAAEPALQEETGASQPADASGAIELPETTQASQTSDASPPAVAEPGSSEASDDLQTGSLEAQARKEGGTPQEPPTQEKASVPDIHDMPRSVQKRVPEMTFNAHLHSSNPSSRSVMINNQMLREGDRVGAMVIKEITPAGVVFRLDEHVFQIGIVRDWQGAL